MFDVEFLYDIRRIIILEIGNTSVRIVFKRCSLKLLRYQPNLCMQRITYYCLETNENYLDIKLQFNQTMVLVVYLKQNPIK